MNALHIYPRKISECKNGTQPLSLLDAYVFDAVYLRMCSFHCCYMLWMLQRKESQFKSSQSLSQSHYMANSVISCFLCLAGLFCVCVFFFFIQFFLNNNAVQLITLCIYHLFCFHNFFFCFCETMLNQLCCLQRNCTFFFTSYHRYIICCYYLVWSFFP